MLTKVGDDQETRYWYISGLTVNNGGSGYLPSDTISLACTDCPEGQGPEFASFVLQRKEPEITASVAGGSGAELTVTLTQETDYENADIWRVSGVKVDNGGDGYTNGASVDFSIAKNDVEIFKAEATIRNQTVEPTLTLDGNATATITLASNGGTPETWRIDEIEVTDGGTGYQDGESLQALLSEGDQDTSPASLTARTVLVEPTVAVSVIYTSGIGAQLTATLVPQTDYYGRTTWTVSEIDVVEGGAGYSEWDYVIITPTDGQGDGFFYGALTVDNDGAITGVTVYYGGSYYKDTGVLSSVIVNSGGNYWRPTGVIAAVEVTGGGWYYKTNGAIESASVGYYGSGQYFRVNPTGQVSADTPAVLFRSYIGTGATATATVDTDLSSDTFGQVTGINVTSGGQDYLEGGVGWVLSIGIAGFFHRESLLGVEKEPSPDNEDARSCANYFDKYLPIKQRAAYSNCPAELLSKTYKMGYSAGSPFGDPSGEDLEQADWCHTITQVPTFYGPVPTWAFSFFGFNGGSDITVALSAID